MHDMRWSCVAAVVLVVASVTIAAAPATRPAAPRIAVGVEAPDFELPRLTIETGQDGKGAGKVSDEKVRLSSFRGKQPVFIVLSSYT